MVAIFERLVELAERNGPVTVLPEKTRIAFQVRMSFAAFAAPALGRRARGPGPAARHPQFRRVETFSPRGHLHQFRLERLSEVDEEVAAWLAEAYRVGEQRHLER